MQCMGVTACIAPHATSHKWSTSCACCKHARAFLHSSTLVASAPRVALVGRYIRWVGDIVRLPCPPDGFAKVTRTCPFITSSVWACARGWGVQLQIWQLSTPHQNSLQGGWPSMMLTGQKAVRHSHSLRCLCFSLRMPSQCAVAADNTACATCRWPAAQRLRQPCFLTQLTSSHQAKALGTLRSSLDDRHCTNWPVRTSLMATGSGRPCTRTLVSPAKHVTWPAKADQYGMRGWLLRY